MYFAFRPSKNRTYDRARWLRGNARDSHSGGPEFPWPTILLEVFSGFLNLKIAKELFVFKDKCRVGPHIPLLMIQFNITRDLNLLLSKW